MLHIFLITITIGFTSLGFGRDKRPSIQQEKQEAIEKLEKRKKGFEKYQKQMKLWDIKRRATADQMKDIRRKEQEEKERARRQFVRPERKFPKKQYRAFIERRDKRDEERNKARKEYSQMQKELKKIYQNPKYNIDGKKEFKL